MEFLEQTRIPFSVSGIGVPGETIVFKPASIHNKILHGIYFFTGDQNLDLTGISQSIVFASHEPESESGNIIIIVSNPQLTHYKLAQIGEIKPQPGIHPTAIIDHEAVISPLAHIGPYCVIGKCTIEDNAVLMNTITVNDNCIIRKNTVIESHTVIGARGMAWIWDDQGERVMQAQSGGVIIEEECMLGTGITIVRGSLSENTIIGKGTVMAHGTRIGHGCLIGNHTHFANNVSLAGNVRTGERVFLGSGSVLSSNVFIGEGCIVGAGAVVHKSMPEPYCTIAGVPAIIIKRNNFESKPKGAPKPYQKR
jgi:UDP-3-O-[3-hydroxymyristoyl] glucosamine N-acyltransferase